MNILFNIWTTNADANIAKECKQLHKYSVAVKHIIDNLKAVQRHIPNNLKASHGTLN